MKILFVGSVTKMEDCTKHLGPSVAGNKMQLGIIKGLQYHYGEDVSVLTQYPIASFPNEKRIHINAKKIKLIDDIQAIKVPFINIMIIKQITKIINTYRLIKKWGKENNDELKVVICYNAFPEIALPVLWGSKLVGAKTVCLLADLPIDGVVKDSFFKKGARKLQYKSTRKNIREFDGIAPLNKNAVKQYAPSSKYLVLDGGFDPVDLPITLCGGQWRNLSDNEPIRVIYSGALTEYNGIRNLIEAAKLVKNPRFRLEIYGSGQLVDYVKKESSKDDRINYMGMVSSDEILKIQSQAALLVSSLLPDHPVTEVAFPSKIVEYLLSGTPVVSTKASGLGQDYLEHMFVFEDITPQKMAETIDYILSLDRKILVRKATDARHFIIKNKNWIVQCQRLGKFCEDLLNGSN